MVHKYLSTPEKKAIIQAKETGMSNRDVAAAHGIDHSSASKIYTRYRKEGVVSRKPKDGRRRKTTDRQERTLTKWVKMDPTLSAADVRHYAREVFNVNISLSTARRILNRHKLFARRPAPKPKINQRHAKARLDYACSHSHWSVQDWGRVLWSDETKFNLFTADGGMFIRRPKNKRYNSAYVKSTVKFGAGSLMAWGRLFP